ncbi:acyl-CoA dehydrogenase family protein [Flavobacteriaceae bacterium]|nr:acyl-CoA dehydrogenase family protein [Flavobacteriaceae bacterium]RCL65635.1 MAG: isovaleryl-CoA dehydrogenase [Cryomorphaceae bacterium]|tara:strand:+ start:3026 stop:4204 length:1179 start_codon:yes stop_codon:yes gene_type:complete
MQSKTDQFGLNEEQEAILEAADKFGKKELYPLAEKMDNEEWWPEGIFKKMADAGLLGLTIDPKYGGAGMSYLQAGLVCQAFGRWNHAIALSWVAHDNLCLDNIYRNGSDYIKEKYLPGLCSGKLIGALGLTEPGSGSDSLGSMRTSAIKKDDHYVLNGSKTYITNGSIADIILVYAKTDLNKKNKGITAFVIETDNPGFKVVSKLKKMGYRGSQTTELFFEDFKVPAENVLGIEGKGHITVMNGLDSERAMIAPICLGISERALDISVEYSKIREQFGKPISSFQMIQSKLAEMYTLVQSIRSLVYSVLSQCDTIDKKEFGKGKIHMNTAASVMFASSTTNKILEETVQIHGGMGYMWESEANRLYRSSKLLDIGAGTTEVRKMIISKELLK